MYSVNHISNLWKNFHGSLSIKFENGTVILLTAPTNSVYIMLCPLCCSTTVVDRKSTATCDSKKLNLIDSCFSVALFSDKYM